MVALTGRVSLRRRAYEVLDVGSSHDAVSRMVHRALVVLIVVSVLCAVLETVPSLRERFGRLFLAIEWLALVLLSAEYIVRLWAAVEHAPYRDWPAWRARIAYAVQPSALVDLLAVAPFYLALLMEAESLRVLLIFRLLRFFKLTRYSPGMRSLADAIQSERRALAACLVILFGLMIVAAAAMHVAEHEAQPDKLGTIPDAMYWAVVTLTTVGYGDISPVTPLGKVIAGITAVFGLVMVALPIGIIATAFTEVIHRNDFVVTWGMVARVPLFAELKAAEIAGIMRCLHSRMAEPGEVVVRRDDPAESMYFVAAGEVEVEWPHGARSMGVGEFFGEVAILHAGHRTATVRALTRAKLLVLDASDFRRLMDEEPDLARRVRAMAASRAGQPLEPSGDVTGGELAREGLPDQADRADSGATAPG